MNVICHYCRRPRKAIRSLLCPGNAKGHYYVKALDPKTDHAQRQIPRLDKAPGVQFGLKLP